MPTANDINAAVKLVLTPFVSLLLIPAYTGISVPLVKQSITNNKGFAGI